MPKTPNDIEAAYQRAERVLKALFPVEVVGEGSWWPKHPEAQVFLVQLRPRGQSLGSAAHGLVWTFDWALSLSLRRRLSYGEQQDALAAAGSGRMRESEQEGAIYSDEIETPIEFDATKVTMCVREFAAAALRVQAAVSRHR